MHVVPRYQQINAQHPFHYPAKRGLVQGSWGNVPSKCSVQFRGSYAHANHDMSPHFSTNAASSDSRLHSGEFRAICMVHHHSSFLENSVKTDFRCGTNQVQVRNRKWNKSLLKAFKKFKADEKYKKLAPKHGRLTVSYRRSRKKCSQLCDFANARISTKSASKVCWGYAYSKTSTITQIVKNEKNKPFVLRANCLLMDRAPPWRHKPPQSHFPSDFLFCRQAATLNRFSLPKDAEVTNVRLKKSGHAKDGGQVLDPRSSQLWFEPDAVTVVPRALPPIKTKDTGTTIAQVFPPQSPLPDIFPPYILYNFSSKHLLSTSWKSSHRLCDTYAQKLPVNVLSHEMLCA